jgi:hypothetical protein
MTQNYDLEEQATLLTLNVANMVDEGKLIEALDTQDKAALVGNDKVKLTSRIKDTRSVLYDKWRKRFANCKVDFPNKMMRSKCGQYALVWLLRPNPFLPDSYDNQQTLVGTVELFDLGINNIRIDNATVYKSVIRRLLLEAQDPREQMEQLFNLLEEMGGETITYLEDEDNND